MRKFILVTAMVLASATAYAGDRSLTLASSDEPAAAAPANATPAAESPQFVERPSVAQPAAAQCQPAGTTAETARPTHKPVTMSERPGHRRVSTGSRVIAELHRHGIYW